jgi:hypothetical protein
MVGSFTNDADNRFCRPFRSFWGWQFPITPSIDGIRTNVNLLFKEL